MDVGTPHSHLDTDVSNVTTELSTIIVVSAFEDTDLSAPLCASKDIIRSGLELVAPIPGAGSLW